MKEAEERRLRHTPSPSSSSSRRPVENENRGFHRRRGNALSLSLLVCGRKRSSLLLKDQFHDQRRKAGATLLHLPKVVEERFEKKLFCVSGEKSVGISEKIAEPSVSSRSAFDKLPAAGVARYASRKLSRVRVLISPNDEIYIALLLAKVLSRNLDPDS